VETHLKEAVLTRAQKGDLQLSWILKTGEILAMANEMGFNPNNVDGLTPEKWRNRAVTDFLIRDQPSNLF